MRLLHRGGVCAVSLLLALALLQGGCGGDKSTAQSLNPNAGNGSATIDSSAWQKVFPVVMQPQQPVEFPDKGVSWISPADVLKLIPPARQTACSGTGWLKSGGSYDDVLPQAHVLREGDNSQLGRYQPQWQAGDPLANLAYGIYIWNLRGFTASPTMKFSWVTGSEPADYANFYVGFANVNRDTWDWYAGPADSVLTLLSYGQYRDATGQMLMIVVMLGTQEVVLESMEAGVPETRGTGAEPVDPGIIPDYPLLGGSGSLPASVDLSSDCAPVNDQGSWGACTAFAVGDGAYNYELNMIYGTLGWNLQSAVYRVSPKHLYIQSGILEGFPPGGDYGRYTDQVIDGLMTDGVATEQHVPYDFIYNPSFGPEAAADAQVLRINSWQTVECNTWAGINNVKAILAQQRKPLPMQMYLDDSFFLYEAGQVWMPWSDYIVGGHAMCIVGYDDAKGGFKVRNSWGDAWGENGYLWIAYEAFLMPFTGALAFTMTEEYDPAVVERFHLQTGGWAPVLGVAASDGTVAGGIQLSWQQHDRATRYLIYRDWRSNLVHTVEGAASTTWLDDGIADGYGHVYWVQPNDGVNGGPLSTPDVGYAAHAPEVLSVAPLTGVEATELTFSAAGYGSGPLTYSWNFGGGASPNTSSEARPHVTLGTPGSYSCRLTLTNGLGFDKFDFTLEVTGVQPRISYIEHRSGFAGDTISPQAAMTGLASGYSWNFGGGATPNTSTQAAPAVTLGTAGQYEASLTITSDWGNDTFNFLLTVLDPAATDWPMNGHDSRNSGLSPMLGPQTNNVKWKYYAAVPETLVLDSDIANVLALPDGDIIVSCHRSSKIASLRRLNPDGTVQWIKWLSGETYFEQPMLGQYSGNLYVKEYLDMVALDPDDGSERWRYPSQNYQPYPIAESANGYLYISGSSYWLYALDSADGSVVLDPLQIGDRGFYYGAGVLAPNGMLFVASKVGYDPRLTAFNTLTGTPAGSLSTTGQVNGMALSPDGLTLYTKDDAGYTIAYDTQSCTQLWARTSGSGSPPRVMADGSVVVSSIRGHVYVFDPDSGATIWDYDLALEHDGNSAAAIGRDGTIYVGGGDLKLYALRDGALIWTSPDAHTWEFGQVPSLGADGTLYASDRKGWLWAFGSGSGEERVPASVNNVTPTQGDQGTVVAFVAEVNGNTPLTYAWDFGGGATPNTSSDPSPSVTLGAPGYYSATLTLQNALGDYTYAFDLSVYSGGGNTDPVADLTADVTQGDPPLTVTLDASGSTDLEGPIAKFEFRSTNQVNNYVDNGANPLYPCVYGVSGTYTAEVRVTDLEGATGYATLAITVNGGQPHVTTISEGNSDTGGFYPRLISADGRPAISYRNEATGQLYFQRAADAEGAAWDPATVIDDTCTGLMRDSLMLVQGNPAIAYVDQTSKDLRYVRATDAEGSVWSNPVTVAIDVASTDVTNVRPVMIIANGMPAIAYYEPDSHRLRYIRAADASGATWGSSVVVVDGGSYLLHGQAMALIAGQPAILLYEVDGRGALYIRATDAGGASWGTAYQVAAPGDFYFGALVEAGGLPAFTSYSMGSQPTDGVYFNRGSNANGSAWAAPVFVSNQPQTGRWSRHGDLCYFDSQYVCVYVDDQQEGLFEKRAFSLNGASWTEQVRIRSGSFGVANSAAVINGNFGLAFYDNSRGSMYYYSIY